MERQKNKGLYMVVSVLVAIGLWTYVVGALNPDSSGPVRNLPVTFAGTNVLESRELMITSGLEQTVTLNVTGKRDALLALSADTVSVTIDVSSITQPGQYSSEYQVSYSPPPGVSFNSVAIMDRYPQTVSFTVVRQATRTIPIRGTSTGSVAEGYQVGEFSFTPETLEVRGEEALVNQIDYALVTLDQEDMSETYNGDLPYVFVTFTGDVMDPAGLETSDTLIRTTLPVFQLKEVPLTVNIIPGGGATDKNVKVDIEPESIVVSGAPADLEPLKEISLGDIDLAKVMGSDMLTFPITLSSELTNVSGVAEATVALTMEGLTTATLEVNNIELIHCPEGYTASAVTQTRQIQIRGAADAVNAVAASQLLIVADLANTVTATGTQTIPVKVYLNGRNDVGVVGDYNIVVSVVRQ
jgi:YbbR domain-containing protein